MNAPTSASAAHASGHAGAHAAAHSPANATSHPANSPVAHPARFEDGDKSFIARLASSSIDQLDGLIAELKQMREVLMFEGERLQREAGGYAQLAQTALAVARAITETVSPGRS